jgi:hypothetical protein
VSSELSDEAQHATTAVQKRTSVASDIESIASNGTWL